MFSIYESRLNMSNNNNNTNNKSCKDDAPFYYKKINYIGERSPVDDDDIKNIGTKPSSDFQSSPIAIEILVPHSGCYYFMPW